MNFKITLLTSAKKTAGILTPQEMYRLTGGGLYLNNLKILIHEHRISFELLSSFKISFNSGFQYVSLVLLLLNIFLSISILSVLL